VLKLRDFVAGLDGASSSSGASSGVVTVSELGPDLAVEGIRKAVLSTDEQLM